MARGRRGLPELEALVTRGGSGGRSPGPEATRRRILDAAEIAFASKGFDGASMREITESAGVNVAAIHYHFGSKEELLRAVLTRIVQPVNSERLARLMAAETASDPSPAGVEAILEAFIAPDLRVINELGRRGAVISRFMGRSYTEPSDLVRRMVREQFGELAERFVDALSRAISDVPRRELSWRLMAVVAVITSMLASESDGLLDPDDLDRTLDRMVAFLAPGLRAPARRPRTRRRGRRSGPVSQPARPPSGNRATSTTAN